MIQSTSVDLLMVWSPTTYPLRSKYGVRRWRYNGKVYHEVPLDKLFQEGDHLESRAFHEAERIIGFAPHRLSGDDHEEPATP